MKINILSLLSLFILLQSCGSDQSEEPEITFQNKGHELVYQMVEKVGSMDVLKAHVDVEYTYTYQTPDGKTDVSREKYIFDGEYSYGAYQPHERTLPQFDGLLEQGFNGNEYWLKVNGEEVTDAEALNAVKFNRPTNYFWFAMFQKLLDPGIKYDYLGETTKDEAKYDIVKISYNSSRPTDIYQLYINQKTKLVDFFLFTVVDKGVVDTPLLMQLEYEKVDDLLIPTKRKYKKSNWEADVSEAPWIHVNWTDIQFNKGLSKKIFDKNYQMELE